jgi:hypothetical protein
VSDRGPFARSILRACRSQKRVSVMACVSAHRVRSRVLVSSTFPSSPTSSCAKATLTTTPCCRRAPAQCPAKESTAFPTPTQPYSTPPHVAATCFTKERSATSTGVEGDCRGPRAFVFTPRRHPRLRSDARRPGWAVCCERRAFAPADASFGPEARRQDQIESQLPAPSQPWKCSTADRALLTPAAFPNPLFPCTDFNARA